jgi:hypothetical protein
VLDVPEDGGEIIFNLIETRMDVDKRLAECGNIFLRLLKFLGYRQLVLVTKIF